MSHEREMTGIGEVLTAGQKRSWVLSFFLSLKDILQACVSFIVITPFMKGKRSSFFISVYTRSGGRSNRSIAKHKQST